MISTGRGAGPQLDFERFAVDALPRLVRFTAAMCADRGIAEDVVQEVLIRVHAAAAVAVVAVAFVVVLPGDDPHRPAAQASGSGPTWARPCTTTGRPHLADITLRPVAGLAATSLVTSACSGVATREIKTDRGHDSGYVAVFQRGVFDTSLLAHARPASGGGVHGYAAAIPADELQPGLPYGVSLGCVARNGRPGATTLTGPLACKYDVLAWRYAPGSWALL